MKTSGWLEKMNILSLIEPIRESVRKKKSHLQVCEAAFSSFIIGLKIIISWYQSIRNHVRGPVVLRGSLNIDYAAALYTPLVCSVTEFTKQPQTVCVETTQGFICFPIKSFFLPQIVHWLYYNFSLDFFDYVFEITSYKHCSN